MSREAHVRFWESVGVRFPRATHLPLYRQHQRLIDAGFTLSRPWLTQLVQQAALLLESIYEALLAQNSAGANRGNSAGVLAHLPR